MKSKDSIVKGLNFENSKDKFNPLEAQTAINQQPVFLPGIPESNRYNPNHSIQKSGGALTDDEGPGADSKF